MPLTRRRLSIVAALLAIFGFAAGVRFYGLNWDDGHHLHPDERFLAMVGGAIRFPSDPLAYFDTRRSTLNPYNNRFDGFAYGTAPLFLARAVAERFDLANYDGFPIVGRALSALADLGTVALVFLLGRRVYGATVGLVAAALSAATVLHIQLSHFFAVDTFLAFATTLALWAAYRTWRRPGYRNAGLLGFACGLALATKLSAALLAPVVLLALVVPHPGTRRRLPPLDIVALLSVVGLVALAVYRIGEPYSFTGPSILGISPNLQRFEDLNRWVRISSGEIEVPFMIQWANTPNPRFALEGIVWWGFGPLAGLSALAGLAVATLEMVRWKRHGHNLLLVVWALINLGYFGFQYAKFLRYFLPLYPALAVLAAYFLVRALPALIGRLPSLAAPARRLAMAATAVVVIGTGFYALAFLAIYSRPNTRVTASHWIYQNLPPGSTLGTEHWDDSLPLRLPGYDHRFAEVSMTLYDEETPEKARKLNDALDRADYLILSSDRLYRSIPRVPQRYPLAIEYYRALFDGRLGFDLVAEIDSHPELFGITIDTFEAQEDFTVYDHPTVMIFQKSDRYSSADIRRLFASVPIDQAERVKPVEAASRRGLMLTPAEAARVTVSGTWSDMFALDGLTTTLALPIWLVVVELLGLAAFPLCWRLLPSLADRGWGAGKILGLVGVSYLTWLLASVGVASAGRGLAYVGVLALIAAGAHIAYHQRAELRAELRRSWRAILAVEAVFLGGFALFLAIRALNPDLWHPSFGGEKPMDFAYLNAVVKTPSFPPYDPWFAGGYINYYYYGFVLVATLIHLSGVPPFVAYNLAIPTIFGLAVAGAASAAIALVAGPYGRRGVGRLAVSAGIISAVALGVLGNLDGAVQIVDGLAKLGGAGLQTTIPVVNGLTRVLIGLGTLFLGAPRPSFDFWRSTRFIGPEDPGPIHEFPFFTFLYGDLHAHMLSMPLQVAVVLVGIQAVRLAKPEVLAFTGLRSPLTRLRSLRAMARPAALVAVLAVLLGSLRTTNTWELPTYLALVGLLGVIATRPGRWLDWPRAIAAGAVALALVYALSSIVFAPFLSRYELFYSGVVPTKTPTSPWQFLLINGVLLFALAGLLVYQLGRVSDVGRALGHGIAGMPRARTTAYAAAFAPTIGLGAEGQISGSAGLLFLLALLLWVGGYGTLGVLTLVGGLVLALTVARRTSREALLWLGIAAAALGALALPEVVAVKGDVGRMNTVFKFFLQAWILLSILAGPSVVMLARSLFGRLAPNRPGIPWRYVWAASLGVLVLGAAIYPVFAVRVKVPLRFSPSWPTLDGMAFMERAAYVDRSTDLDLPSDYHAIRWMLQNVAGSPVILEGVAPLYHWGARFSIYTGLPAVLGWDWHQKQQRAGYQERVDQRQRDVARFYESTDPEAARTIIRRYGVQYVVVGGLERAYYPAAGLEKLERMVGSGLDVAYRDGSVTIYRVVRP